MKTTTISRLLALALLGALASAQGVRINECDTGVPDHCELANLSSAPVHLGGWTVIMSDDPSTTTTFTFPPGTVLNPNQVLLVSENATTPAVPAGVQRFVSANINWANTGGGACGLNDPAGAGVDRVLWGGATNLPAQNPVSPFTGSLPAPDVLRRISSVDTDTAADWATSTPAGTGTPGNLNPGQTPIAPSAPNAAFLVVSSPAFAGSLVRFIDQTSGIATSWQWDLDGNGTTDSTAQHPTFVYTAPGAYTVSLTASNALGTDGVTVVNAVVVLPSPAVGAPYSQPFSSPALGPEWTLVSEPNGRIQVGLNGTPSPASGGTALMMDTISAGALATNQARLRVNLAAGGILTYWARETADEEHPEDGVFLTNGAQTVQISSHAGTLSAWTFFVVDLAAAAAQAGFAPGADLEVVFQQRDNNPIPTDGILIDDVLIALPPPGQANQPGAALDVNGGVNALGIPATIGTSGPFFASGSTLDLTVDGAPGAVYALALGPLNPDNIVFPGLGSLDIGTGGGLGGVAFVLNGFAPVTLFDSFAALDAAGSSTLSLGLSTLPPGVLGAFQAVVQAGAGIALTAAFEFTVD